MYSLVEDASDIRDLEEWLAFEDRNSFDPIEDGWITVNRHGHHRVETGSGEVDALRGTVSKRVCHQSYLRIFI